MHVLLSGSNSLTGGNNGAGIQVMHTQETPADPVSSDDTIINDEDVPLANLPEEPQTAPAHKKKAKTRERTSQSGILTSAALLTACGILLLYRKRTIKR